jgi:flavodoxin
MIDYNTLSNYEVVDILNNLQKNGYIRIMNYENLEIKIRPQLQKLIETEVMDFISQYRSLFKGKKQGVMGSSETCNKNMAEFMRAYPQYSKQHILKATEAYIQSCQGNNYTYLQQADYFIFKNQDHTRINKISRLLQWCEEINDNTIISTERIEGI